MFAASRTSGTVRLQLRTNRPEHRVARLALRARGINNGRSVQNSDQRNRAMAAICVIDVAVARLQWRDESIRYSHERRIADDVQARVRYCVPGVIKCRNRKTKWRIPHSRTHKPLGNNFLDDVAPYRCRRVEPASRKHHPRDPVIPALNPVSVSNNENRITSSRRVLNWYPLNNYPFAIHDMNIQRLNDRCVDDQRIGRYRNPRWGRI